MGRCRPTGPTPVSTGGAARAHLALQLRVVGEGGEEAHLELLVVGRQQHAPRRRDEGVAHADGEWLAVGREHRRDAARHLLQVGRACGEAARARRELLPAAVEPRAALRAAIDDTLEVPVG